MNTLIDTEINPAIEKVEGVRAVQVYNSITGDVTWVLDVHDMAMIDRIIADPGCKAVLGKALAYLVRIGGEILYDRPMWQGLYGRSS
jgi:hypothetical protein